MTRPHPLDTHLAERTNTLHTLTTTHRPRHHGPPTTDPTEARRLATDWHGAGYPADTLGDGRGGGDGDTMSRHVQRLRHDPTATALDKLDQLTNNALVAIDALTHHVAWVLDHHPTPDRVTRLVVCANRHCQTILDGPPTDGRCPPCAAYRRTHHGADAGPTTIDARRRQRDHRT